MNAVDVNTADSGGSLRRAGYRRSAGSPRGEARRRELLDRVVDDLAVNGLVDFSLRRAARAAGTTHKVLLYHFDGADDLLRQAILELRERRIVNSPAAMRDVQPQTLAARVRSVWPALIGEESRVLDQAMGLMMYDPGRYAELGRGATQQYMPPLLSICPQDWPELRKLEVSEMILAVLRGFLIDRLASGNTEGVDAGFEAAGRLSPGMFGLFMQQLRVRAVRRLPIAFGWLTKRGDAATARWIRPVLTEPAIRRDTVRVLRAAAADTGLLVRVAERLPGFTHPALVVWASADRVMPPEHGRRLAALMPQARLAEVDDCYTLIPLDQPARLAELIREFTLVDASR